MNEVDGWRAGGAGGGERHLPISIWGPTGARMHDAAIDGVATHCISVYTPSKTNRYCSQENPMLMFFDGKVMAQ